MKNKPLKVFWYRFWAGPKKKPAVEEYFHYFHFRPLTAKSLRDDWEHWVKNTPLITGDGGVERITKLPEKELANQLGLYEYNIMSATKVYDSLKLMR